MEYRKDLNNQPNECRWPILNGRRVVDCGFNFEFIEIEKGIFIAKLKSNSKIYHATQIFLSDWFNKQYPMNTNLGGIWFASTPEHSANISSFTHILEYTVKNDVYLIYVQSLKTYGKNIRGYEFIAKYYLDLKDKAEDSGYKIAGYASCGECEIFLENDSIKNALEKIPKVFFKRDSKFID